MARRKADPEDQSVTGKLRRLIDARCGDRKHEDIARAVGLTPATFSRIINGKMETTVSRLMAILDEIGADLCDLHNA